MAASSGTLRATDAGSCHLTARTYISTQIARAYISKQIRKPTRTRTHARTQMWALPRSCAALSSLVACLLASLCMHARLAETRARTRARRRMGETQMRAHKALAMQRRGRRGRPRSGRRCRWERGSRGKRGGCWGAANRLPRMCVCVCVCVCAFTH